jgi:NAD(P)-dependent dehydrogenase (short-subunit alcohol dehydrogenase family)
LLNPSVASKKELYASMIPMGRIGQPKEIATTALFLASDDSSFISGIELCVDGGLAQI